mgnify:CR=1 FL=1
MKSTTDIQMSKIPGNSFNDIYTSYYKKSFFFAKSYVHNDLAAEDIASEALIKLWEKLKAEPVEEKYILPLLLTILKNKALDYLKHEEVKRSAFEVMADWQQQELSIRMSALEACNPDEIFSEEVEKIISATLSTLSEQTRRAFILSRFENKSNKEIAEEMEISIKGVEYHISKSIESTAGDFKRLSSFILFLLLLLSLTGWGYGCFLRTKTIFFIYFSSFSFRVISS